MKDELHRPAPPIFVVGCGRSGTTLARTLLNRHESLAIPLESLFIIDYLRASRAVDLELLKRMIVVEPEIEEWGIHPTVAQLHACGSIGEVIDMIHRIYAGSHGKSRWGQKTPRFVRHLDLLLQHFPGARFVHLVRDPRGVVSSLICSNVHNSDAYHGSLRWRMDVSAGLEFERRHPDRVMRIRYEDLVGDPERSLRLMSVFLLLDYDPKMLREDARDSSEYSAFYSQIHAHVGRKPTAEFVSKWEESLDPDEVRVVEAVAGEIMEPLGYKRTLHAAALAGRDIWTMRAKRARGLMKQTAQYLRFRRTYFAHLLYRKWRLGLLRDFLWGINY